MKRLDRPWLYATDDHSDREASAFLCGPLPGPATLNLHFERDTEKSADHHHDSQQPNALKCKRGGDRCDSVRADEEFESEQDPPSNVGTVMRISRSPVSCTQAIAEQRDCGDDNTAEDDRSSSKFERFGKLINKDMGLLSKHARFLDLWG